MVEETEGQRGHEGDGAEHVHKEHKRQKDVRWRLTTRLFALLRGVVWDRFDLCGLLQFYGTARVINYQK